MSLTDFAYGLDSDLRAPSRLPSNQRARFGFDRVLIRVRRRTVSFQVAMRQVARMESRENEFTVNRHGVMSPSPGESPEFSVDVSASEMVPRRLYAASLLGFFAVYQPDSASRAGRDPDKNKAA